MWLLAGLGNPGARYEHTRHNIGFWAIDAVASREHFPAFSKKFKGLVAQGELTSQARTERPRAPAASEAASHGGGQQTGAGDISKIILLKPQTFMNLSGESVQQAMQFYKIPPEKLIVLHDEIDLPLGEVKLKKGGGSAGHNGLKSIAEHIGPDFGRIRIGVGHPRGTPKGVADHVLEPFSKEEQPIAEEVVALLTQHIGECLSLFEQENFANRKFITPKEGSGQT